MARDRRCRMCGTTRALAIHHIRYKSQGIDHSPLNLIVLCNDVCHGIVHSRKRHWQPICLAYIWLRYAERRNLSLLQVEKLVSRSG
jgi:hypothetical protein